MAVIHRWSPEFDKNWLNIRSELPIVSKKLQLNLSAVSSPVIYWGLSLIVLHYDDNADAKRLCRNARAGSAVRSDQRRPDQKSDGSGHGDRGNIQPGKPSPATHQWYPSSGRTLPRKTQ